MNVITVEKRDFTVKAKQLRRAGIVPGSVCGGTLPNSVSLQMDQAVAKKIIRSQREGSKVDLSLEGKIIPVQIKEKTINTLNNEILHITFQALKEDQKINSVIHIILKNPEKIMGALEKMTMEIPYSSLPDDMIDTITIDLDGLTAGTIITVGDIPELNTDKIELKVDTEEIVLRVNDRKLASKQIAEQ